MNIYQADAARRMASFHRWNDAIGSECRLMSSVGERSSQHTDCAIHLINENEGLDTTDKTKGKLVFVHDLVGR